MSKKKPEIKYQNKINGESVEMGESKLFIEEINNNSRDESHPPRLSRVARAIGWVTFLEVIRDKILYNVVLCAFFLFFMGFLASKLNFLEPERIVLDFGLLTLNVSCSFISILVGSNLLPKEFDRRTIYVALSHPISRPQFIFGKFMGLVFVMTVNWALQTSSYLTLLSLSSPLGPFSAYSGTLIWALVYMWMQSLVLCSLAILFSTISTASLSVIFSIGIYLIGNSISQLRLLATKLQSEIASGLLNGISNVLPNFEYFNLGSKVTYGLPITWQYGNLGILYGIIVIAVCLVLAGMLIQNREI